jgi:hypothetical protein
MADWTLLEIVGLIPQEDLFKMNIDMPGPFWRDWEWSGVLGAPWFSMIYINIMSLH